MSAPVGPQPIFDTEHSFDTEYSAVWREAMLSTVEDSDGTDA